MRVPSSKTGRPRHEHSPLTPRTLRDVLGLFPTGITVVTAAGAEETPYGVTVNSFNSVSLDPPLVLFSLARGLCSLNALLSSQAFAVNFLREDQQHLSRQFATPFSPKWQNVKYRVGVTGSPVLEPVLAVLECRLYAQYDGGDHVIIVGRVVHVEKHIGHNPLLFFCGRYHTLGREAEAPLDNELSQPAEPVD